MLLVGTVQLKRVFKKLRASLRRRRRLSDFLAFNGQILKQAENRVVDSRRRSGFVNRVCCPQLLVSRINLRLVTTAKKNF